MHSAETTSGVNGPGLRYTVFLSGCPLRCLYCHNPDTQTMRLGERTTARRVIEEAGRYRAFISRGGGLTVTGGEPLLQAAFVEDLFVGVKEAYGLHTALDTSANGGHRASDRLLANTDLVLLDIKAGNAALYEKVSGGGRLGDVLDFGARLVEHRIAVWIRFVLVPGLTDGPDADRRGGRPGRRSRRRSWSGSRCCPTTGSASTSTPRSDAPTPCWARPHRPGSRWTRPWRSSASAACTPWPDPGRRRSRVAASWMDQRGAGSRGGSPSSAVAGDRGGRRSGRQAGEDVLGRQRAPDGRSAERAPMPARHMSTVAQLISPRRRMTRASDSIAMPIAPR